MLFNFLSVLFCLEYAHAYSYGLEFFKFYYLDLKFEYKLRNWLRIVIIEFGIGDGLENYAQCFLIGYWSSKWY